MPPSAPRTDPSAGELLIEARLVGGVELGEQLLHASTA